MENQVVVTRHPALVEYLREEGVIDETTEIIEHASPDDVRGRHVIGVLPHHLSAEAASVTEVPLNLPPELRGQELTVEQVRQYAVTVLALSSPHSSRTVANSLYSG